VPGCLLPVIHRAASSPEAKVERAARDHGGAEAERPASSPATAAPAA